MELIYFCHLLGRWVGRAPGPAVTVAIVTSSFLPCPQALVGGEEEGERPSVPLMRLLWLIAAEGGRYLTCVI